MSQAVSAGPKDGAAKKLDKDAMESDFLGASFDAAEKKLNDAVKACGDSGCTPKLKAQILVHLGIVQVNLGKKDDAKKSFQDGLKIDNSVAPEGDYSSDDVKAVFNDAKKGGGSSTPPPKDTGSGTEPPPTPAGELEHEVVKESAVSTPVPLFVGIPEGMKVAKVIVMFRPFGAEEWKKLELKKMGGGYGGEIDCKEVGTTGDLKYYIKAVDSGGDPVAEAGTKNKPLITKVKNQLDGDPPHLPDKAPPAKCITDCPPDFPNCQNVQQCGKGGWGESCGRDKDCKCDYHCKKEEGKDEGVCEEGKPVDGPDGPDGPSASAPFKKNWVGLTLSPDLALISGSDVCGQDSQRDKGYSCFRSDGKQYHGNPTPAAGNAIAGGIAPSTVRLMAGYDRLFGKNFMVGVRLGFAFNGGPKPDGGNAFLPFHGELRLAYWIGSNPFARAGLRPFVFLGGGMAQVDTKVDVSVRESEQCSTYPGALCPVYAGSEVVQYNPQGQTVSAWHKAGQQFVGLGGGAMYAFTPKSGLVGAIKVMQMFPTSGTVISPELGYAMGF